jgi:hypothetical protein
MTLRAYLSIMLAGTLVSWLFVAYVVYSINPFLTNRMGLALFYIAFFLAVSGVAAIIGFLARSVLVKQKMLFKMVSEAFRQSFLFAFLICAALFLLSRNLFTWTNLLLLAISLTVLEFFISGWLKGRSA